LELGTGNLVSEQFLVRFLQALVVFSQEPGAWLLRATGLGRVENGCPMLKMPSPPNALSAKFGGERRARGGENPGVI